MTKDYHLLFNHKDYARLTINVMGDNKPLEQKFFSTNHIFQNTDVGEIDINILIRYIVLFYDPNSPLFDRINDHIERKKAAATLAGWRYDKNELTASVNEILYCKNRQVNEMIIEYLRYLKNPDWAFIVSAWEAYQMVLLDMMSEAISQSKTGSNKTSVDLAAARAELINKADTMAQRLNERTLKFLCQDQSPYLKEGLFDLIDETKNILRITPERISFEN